MKNILFVCTGNICRSPMAEGLFRHLARGRNDLEVSSAGVGAVHGQPPSLHAVEVLRPWGIDISQCRSQPLTEDLVEKATAIFAMTRAHLDTIQLLFPSAAEKAYLMCEFDEELAATGGDIADPIGQGIEAYFQCRDVMKKALPSVLAFIQKTGEKPGLIKEAPVSKRPLRIALGSDESGKELKRNLHSHLSNKGYMVTECGSRSGEIADYPDLAAEVCREIIAQHCDYGILLCANGTGAAIAANRYPRVRALLAESEEKARASRQQIDSNLLALSTGEIDGRQAERIVDAFLQTPFAGGQYEQRVAKLQKLGMGRPNESLAETDAEVFAAIEAEGKRQSENIELIASENFTSRAVMEAQGSVMTNKYAEGYPRRRWYGGCENMDTVEQLAIDRARKLFGGEHINVQAHSGSQANMAVYFSVLEPGDRILTMDLSHGGHLTHGFKANFSGRFFEVAHYGVSRENERIDYDALAAQAEQFKPKMITAGASAYSRIIDFPRLRQIADAVGAYLFVDMAHIAGLVAAGVHPNPVPEADFVTSTTHKSLRGPRGGLNICREKFAKQIDSQIFPGIQGGPLMHVISAKAVCFQEALRPEFREYQRQVVTNAKALAAGMSKNGYRIVSNGTENHLMLVDLRPHGLNGKDSQETLDLAGITVNKNGIPFDTLPISKGGGIRLGTPAVTTRGMKEEEMMEIADLIHDALKLMSDLSGLAGVKKRVINLTQRFPLPY